MHGLIVYKTKSLVESAKTIFFSYNEIIIVH
jgi:hypothetical protein